MLADIPRKCKRAFAQLRCGSPPLAIEQGRYSGTPVEKRLCELCNNGEVESEMHLIMSCPMYVNIRFELFNEACLVDANFLSLNVDEKFIFLMARPEMCKAAAKACFAMLECRRKHLFK